MKSKKASLKTVLTYALFLAILAILFVVVGKGLLTTEKALSYAPCAAQVGVASKGNPIGFSACHTYKLQFEKSAAKKYNMFMEDAYASEYTYTSVLKKLKEVNSDFESLELKSKEPVPQEIVYYILAEEMKLCADTMSPATMETQSYAFEKYNLISCDMTKTTCHFCDLVLFHPDFYAPVFEQDKFKNFLLTTRISESSSLTYYDYFQSKYDSSIDLDQYVKTDLSSNDLFLINILYENDFRENLLIKKKSTIFLGPSLLDAYIVLNDVTKNVKPVNVMLMNLEDQTFECDYHLTLSPTKKC